MKVPKFWPLDYDLDDEIYESIIWDLPGYRTKSQRQPVRRKTGTGNQK